MVERNKELQQYVGIAAADEPVAKLLTDAWNLAAYIFQQRSSRKQDMVQLYQEGLSQSEIAKKVGRSQSTVSANLSSAAMNEEGMAKDLVGYFLSNLIEENNGDV